MCVLSFLFFFWGWGGVYIWRALVVGNLEQAWFYFRRGRCLDPPCLVTMSFTRPWHISPSGSGH